MGFIQKLKTNFSFSLLGPGVFGSWGFLIFFWMRQTSNQNQQSESLYLVSLLVTSLVVMVATHELAGLQTARVMARVGCFVMVLGFALDIVLVCSGNALSSSRLVPQVLIGAGVSLFWIAWAYVLVHFEVERSELVFLWWTPLLAGVFVCVALASAVLKNTIALYALLLFVMPLLSLLAFERSWQSVAAAEQQASSQRLYDEASAAASHSKSSLISYELRIFINLALAYVAISLVWQLFFALYSLEFDASAAFFALGSLLVFCIIWLALRFTRKFGLSTMYLWMLPAMVLGVTLCAGVELGGEASSSGVQLAAAFLCFATVNIGFEIMVKLFSVYLAKRNKPHAWRFISLGSALPSVGGLLAPLIVRGLPVYEGVLNAHQLMLVSLVFFVLVVSLALGRFSASTREVLLWEPGAAAVSAAMFVEGQEQAVGEAGVAEASDSLNERCLVAAQKYGLSARELDVLMLLVQGRSRTYIRETLYISKGTVDTHIHHIYAKLGVSSKDEAMALVLDK